MTEKIKAAARAKDAKGIFAAVLSDQLKKSFGALGKCQHNAVAAFKQGQLESMQIDSITGIPEQATVVCKNGIPDKLTFVKRGGKWYIGVADTGDQCGKSKQPSTRGASDEAVRCQVNWHNESDGHAHEQPKSPP